MAPRTLQPSDEPERSLKKDGIFARTLTEADLDAEVRVDVRRLVLELGVAAR